MQLGIYRHYKNKMYEVIGTVRHSETLEELVLYKALYAQPDFPEGQLRVRPKDMFLESVVVDGVTMPRFTYQEKL